MSDAVQARPQTVEITVDGKTIDARPGELLIAACERNGVYIPRFCYHPRMEPVGMCRMCIVEVDAGRGPALQPSCMLVVSDGMKVDTEGPVTKKAQEGVLEFLLINHPLDCPVCDKGGECPLQDHTMAHGPGESRFVEEKRHFEKPIPISDTVYLDRERCILCDRCTRFASDVAGDPLIHFIDRGNQTQVNTFPDHPFASYFSGNTVQICPVGALTAKPYRFRARPWDLEQVETTCTTCAVGCRVVAQSSRNRVVRYQGHDVDPVNWGWLCDKGRFGHDATNSDARLGEPMVREGDLLEATTWSTALGRATDAIKAGLDRSGPAGLAVIGGARLTNEAAYVWTKLVKGVLGSDNVDCQLGDGIAAEAVLGLPRATIDDVCRARGAVLALAPDLKEELPVLFLRLRHALRNDSVQVVELSPRRTPLSELATASVRYRAGEELPLVEALLAGGSDREVAGVSPDAIAAASRLLAESPFTVILGRPNVADRGEGVAAAAAALHAARPNVRFLPALRRGNVHGALDMGMAPGVLPGRLGLDDGRSWFHGSWPTVPSERGLDAAGILRAAADGKIDTLVLLGADPLRDFPDRALAERGLAGARTVIATDLFVTASSRRADVVLAAAGPDEEDGTTSNLEGRVSRVAQVVTPPGTARADWIIAAELALRLGHDLGVGSVDEILDEIDRVAPAFAGVVSALQGPTGSDGVVVPVGEAPDDGRPGLLDYRPERVEPPAVDAYSLRLVATRRLYDEGTLVTHTPAFAGTVRPTSLHVHPHDFDRFGIPTGTTVTITSGSGSTKATVEPHPEVLRGSAEIGFNLPGVEAAAVIDSSAPVTEVRVERA